MCSEGWAAVREDKREEWSPSAESGRGLGQNTGRIHPDWDAPVAVRSGLAPHGRRVLYGSPVGTVRYTRAVPGGGVTDRT